MSLLNLNQISNGDPGDATIVDYNFDAIANLLNGNIEAVNMKDASLTAAKTIYEGWTNYSVVLYKDDHVTSLTGTLVHARSMKNGSNVTVSVSFATISDPSGDQIFFTLPYAQKAAGAGSYAGNRTAGAGYVRSGGVNGIGTVVISGSFTGLAYINKSDFSSFGASDNGFDMTFTYESAA